MQCARCQQPNSPLAKFCQECGAALPRLCASCGHELAPEAKFCAECGASVSRGAQRPAPDDLQQAVPATSADRRQAAVLFADITGYTALCARSDPEQVQDMLANFYDSMDKVIEAHGGRVFDRAGDAVMAVFGAPVAHGNDAQRAVRAALAMHAGAANLIDCEGAPLSLHIGVASGEVVAAVISGGGKSKYSVTGDTVNLAARLVALAESRETFISDALHRSVSSIVEAHAMGERTVKGFDTPVNVWRVEGLRTMERQTAAERLPFIGRQSELRQLIGTLDAVRDSGNGMTILVRGDAGIGKSRLVDEFRSHARHAGWDTPLGQVLDFGVGKGRDAIPTVLKALLGIGAMDDESLRRQALRTAIEQGLVRDDEALFANEWLDLDQPEPLQAIFEAMDNATRQRRAGEALAAMLQRVAAKQPIVIGIEDIHWATPELLRLVASIARATSRAPIIMLLTTRIEGDPLDKAWRASIHGSAFLTVDLAPLRPQEARLLAGGVVEASSRFALLCIERAEGNPLFLEHLLRAAREGEAPGLLPAVPSTIQSLVLERMDRLAAPDRATLQAAAVIGKRFSLKSVRAIIGDPDLTCGVLVGADMIRPDDGDFMFAHALIQEAVYASTLKSKRRELHRAAARWFGDDEPLLQAEHLDRADDAGAAQAYLTAAIVEAGRWRFEAALRLAERGSELAAAADAGPGCELAMLRGEALREAGRSVDSILAFESALDLASSDLQRCQAWMGVAAGHRITGDFAAAMQALNEAQPIAEALDLTIERSRIHHTRGNLFFAQGKADECNEQHALALDLAQLCGDVECQSRALSGLGDALYARGRMRSALEYFRRCVALCGGQIKIAVPNRCMIGHCLWWESDLGAAIAEVTTACEEARRVGVVSVQVFAQTSMTQMLVEAGRFDEADVACGQALALARLAGSRRYESTLLLWLSEIHFRRGELELARRDIELAHDLSRQTGMGFVGAALLARKARVALDAEERDQALAEGEALLKETGLAHSHMWFYRDAIEASLSAREWAKALGYADTLEAFVREEPLLWVELVIERARALVELAQTPRDPAALAKLRQVRSNVVSAQYGWSLAAIDAALQES